MADKYLEETLQYCDQIINDRFIMPTLRETNLIERLRTIIQVHQHQSGEIKEMCNIMQSLLTIQAGPVMQHKHSKGKAGRTETGK